jgi:hypothetical protein
MLDLTTNHGDTRPVDQDQPSPDERYQTRMAWIASLWAAMAVLATVVAIWDSWHVNP